MRSTSSRDSLPGRISRAGIRCRRRSISKPRICCRATSCPRRATAWRWRMRSRAASRSSTTAWSRFAARIPPSLKLRGLTREAHPAQGGERPRSRRDRGAAEAALPRAGQRSPSSALDAPAYVERPARRADDSHVAGCSTPRAVEKLAAKARQRRAGGFRDNAALIGILSTQLWRASLRAGAAPRTNPISIISRQTSGVEGADSMTNDILGRVRTFIEENFLFRDDRSAGLADTESLLENGLIDSTGVLELVAFLETEFALQMSRRRDRSGQSRFGRGDRRLCGAQARRCNRRPDQLPSGELKPCASRSFCATSAGVPGQDGAGRRQARA